MQSRAYQVQAEILEQCLVELSPMPNRVVVVPGAQAVWDSCCDGMLYCALVSLQPKRQAAKCTGWTAVLKVGVIRCCATVDDYGNAPSVRQINHDAELMMNDMTTLQRVLGASSCVDTLDGWEPLGPEGGCAGGEWTVTRHLPFETLD